VCGRVEAVSASIIDSDEHLYEPRSLWMDHIDPGHRPDALTLIDDELGYTWLAWRGRPLVMCCSDFPHSEGSATPLADYATVGCDAGTHPALFHDNVTFLLGRS
jgi:hypothetical protein